MKKKNDTWKPQWVALPILDFVREIHKFDGDDEGLCKWVKKFSEDLLFCNTNTDDDLTKSLLMDSFENYEKQSKAGRKAGLASAKARKQRNSGSATPADKREEGDDNTANDASGIGPEPDSHLNGDALSGDASDGGHTRESAVADRTTVSEQFEARQSQNADGTDINWHEAVCQALGTTDGNDQEAEAQVSQTGAGAAPLQNDSCHNAPAPRFPRKSKPPKNAEEVRYFAADHALDVEDARDWYEMNYVERPGCDKDGVAIENWKGHCTAYCQTMAERRKAG